MLAEVLSAKVPGDLQSALQMGEPTITSALIITDVIVHITIITLKGEEA